MYIGFQQMFIGGFFCTTIIKMNPSLPPSFPSFLSFFDILSAQDIRRCC